MYQIQHQRVEINGALYVIGDTLAPEQFTNEAEIVSLLSTGHIIAL